MAIKAESVERFSLEMIFPSSNYEEAMPELRGHVIAFEILAEPFYTGASIQNAVQGKQMVKVV